MDVESTRTNPTKRTCSTTMQYVRGYIVMWDCMLSIGFGCCCQIRVNINGAVYCGLLQLTLIKPFDYLAQDKNSITFQHDNAANHIAKTITDCLQHLGVTTLQWPTHSLDMNPMENLWDKLKRKLASHENVASCVLNQWNRVMKEWWEIEEEACLHLSDSLPLRIEAIIVAK